MTESVSPDNHSILVKARQKGAERWTCWVCGYESTVMASGRHLLRHFPHKGNQQRMYAAVRNEPGLSISDYAQRLGISASDARRIARRLTEKALLVETDDCRLQLAHASVPASSETANVAPSKVADTTPSETGDRNRSALSSRLSQIQANSARSSQTPLITRAVDLHNGQVLLAFADGTVHIAPLE